LAAEFWRSRQQVVDGCPSAGYGVEGLRRDVGRSAANGDTYSMAA
jgi:hypothetical protein